MEIGIGDWLFIGLVLEKAANLTSWSWIQILGLYVLVSFVMAICNVISKKH